MQKEDKVNHPSHYANTDLPAEVIDIIEPTIKNYPSEVGYHVGNVIKYLLRAPYKNNLKEDVAKAEVYLKRAKDILEDKQHGYARSISIIVWRPYDR